MAGEFGASASRTPACCLGRRRQVPAATTPKATTLQRQGAQTTQPPKTPQVTNTIIIIMPVRHIEQGGTARHGIVQHIETASKAMGVAQGLYAAGRAVAPYVRPVMSAIATAAAAAV
jgi:hypothetical protein